MELHQETPRYLARLRECLDHPPTTSNEVAGPWRFTCLGSGQVPSLPGVGGLLCLPDRLVFAAVWECAAPANAARMDNDQTWRSGDVLEAFLQWEGREDYYEFHVTPELRTLQLHLPSAALFQKVPFPELICEAGVAVVSVVDGARRRWSAAIEAPLSAFGLAGRPRPAFRFMIGRYDCSAGPNQPEISSIPAMKGGFHQPPHWRRWPGETNA